MDPEHVEQGPGDLFFARRQQRVVDQGLVARVSPVIGVASPVSRSKPQMMPLLGSAKPRLRSPRSRGLTTSSPLLRWWPVPKPLPVSHLSRPNSVAKTIIVFDQRLSPVPTPSASVTSAPWSSPMSRSVVSRMRSQWVAWAARWSVWLWSKARKPSVSGSVRVTAELVPVLSNR